MSAENKKQETSATAKEMIAGKHYYFENGFMVFTEAWHTQRGYCCGNGCRHCPYGNAGKKAPRL
jgi:hypothetical protein